MERKNIIQKIEHIPFPVFPTMVGAATLSNVFSGLGFPVIRHITMWACALVLVAAIIKVTVHFKTFSNEYKNPVPASLYAGVTMLLMVFGSYVFDFHQGIGKGLWLAGLAIHWVHLLVFTYRNVVRGVKVETLLPSWFVTYSGILVCNVVGGSMNEPRIATFMAYYGLFVAFVIVPIIVIRIFVRPVAPQFLHTKAICIAPVSLALVSYLNVIPDPNPIIVYVLYIMVILAFLYFVYNLTGFFSVSFHPGFAGLTFPMAIGVVASTKMSAFLATQGYESLSFVVKQISGIQLYITTAVIAFVLWNFFQMFMKSYGGE